MLCGGFIHTLTPLRIVSVEIQSPFLFSPLKNHNFHENNEKNERWYICAEYYQISTNEIAHNDYKINQIDK